MESKLRKFRVQFGLRTALICLLVVGLAAAWLGNRIRLGQRQYQSAMEIANGGNVVLWDHYFDAKGDFITGLTPAPPQPEWVRKLVGEQTFSKVRKLQIGSSFTDKDAKLLGDLFTLKELDLGPSQVTDAALAGIAKLRKLEVLRLSGTKITDEIGAHLSGMPRLETLNLNGTQVSDKLMVEIGKLSRLRSLSLSGTDVSDEGLAQIRDLHDLEWLDLGNVSVTDRGMESLRGFTKLKTLRLTGESISLEGLKHLSAMKELETLHIWRYDVVPFRELVEVLVNEQGRDINDVLKMLGYLWRDRLRLEIPGFNDDDLNLIRGVSGIKTLEFRGDQISDDGMKLLVESFPNLVSLHCGSPNVTDASVPHIGRLIKLRFIAINGDSITEQGIEKLRKLLPNCEVYSSVR